jgi:hypothetical protein
MYILATNLWEILAGVFISRNMPVPANSGMARLAPKVLSKATFNDLILGEVATRKRIALSLCDQIITAHQNRHTRSSILL